MNTKPIQFDQLVVETATKLTVVEVGVGALVHGFKIPFGGHLLSLNQGFFLTRLVKKVKTVEGVHRLPLYVSNISAVLKSLSPVGNKLGPMLSISAQGFLFSLPIFLIGANTLSILLGMALLSIWSFIQPFLTLYLFFGNSLFDAAQFYLDKMQKSLGVQPEWVINALIIAVIVKVTLSQIVGWLGYYSSEEKLTKWDHRITEYGEKFSRAKDSSQEKKKGTFRMVLKDLTRPLFLGSLILMIAFFYFSEGDWAKTIWLSLRPMGIAILFFYICRTPYLSGVAKKLENYRHTKKFMSLLNKTLGKLGL